MAARVRNPNGATAKTDTDALPNTGYRRARWGIQNAGTNVLNVHFGPTTVNLKACDESDDDGTGGSIENEDWDGVVTVSGNSPRYNLFEFLR